MTESEAEQLLRRALDAEQALAALARGEVDAVVIQASATPVLLHAAQERLLASQQLLRAVFDSSGDAVMLADDRGIFIDVNPAASRLLSLPREQIIGHNFADFIMPSADLVGQVRIQRHDGTVRLVEYSAVTNVSPGVHLSILRDITERVAAEEERTVANDALRTSRDMLEEAQAICHVGSWTSGVGLDGTIEWSRECYRIYGIPEGTPMTVAEFYAYVHPEDRVRMHVVTRAALDDGAPAEIEHRIVRPDGQVRRVHQRGVVERDASGTAVRMFGTLQDITDRHAALEATRESEQRYRRIVENTTEGVWMYDAEGVTTFMNARMAEMLGWTVEEAHGMPIFAFMKHASFTTSQERTQQRQRGVSERTNFELVRKDGSALSVSINATPLFDADGRFEAALSLVTDVSALLRADDVRGHLAAIVESSQDAIVSASLDGIITSWNRGAERLYQFTRDEMIGKSMFGLIPEAAIAAECELLGRVAAGEPSSQYECERVRKDMTRVEVAVTVSPVRDANGVVTGLSKIAHDLTARRAAEQAHLHVEEQFRQVQKMEAVGRLAGGVAHDFNNLLTVILSYTEFGIDDLKEGDPLREDMIQIKQAAMRAATLTTQLLAFSRQQVLQPRVVDLAVIIEGMRVMLGRLLGEDIDLTVRCGEKGLRHVLADPGQIEQVIMNLAINARDAMPQGGKLTIETSEIRLGPSYVGGTPGIPPGDYVMVAMSDSGIGMDVATSARIFEPFFTTKPVGKGTGLGLSTVFGIVRQSGGYITVYSELGHGTTFKAYFPCTDQLVDTNRATGRTRALAGTETILLVEDEEQVRTVACAILRRAGYNVLETSNGGEAFMVSTDHAGEIQLLLTDVVMPRMSGRRVAEQLATSRPRMRVLFASGYTDDAVVRHGVLGSGAAFIQKPFTPETLLRKVREVLDAPAALDPELPD